MFDKVWKKVKIWFRAGDWGMRMLGTVIGVTLMLVAVMGPEFLVGLFAVFGWSTILTLGLFNLDDWRLKGWRRPVVTLLVVLGGVVGVISGSMAVLSGDSAAVMISRVVVGTISFLALHFGVLKAYDVIEKEILEELQDD